LQPPAEALLVSSTTRLSPPRSATPSLFSNDIWIEDNTGQSRNFASDVNIVGWTTVGDTKAGGYIVYDCVITLKSAGVIHVLKRYSSFESLMDQLSATLPRHLLHHIPSLPSKTTLGKFRSTFLERRRCALQTWLSVVLLHPEIGACDAVKTWVTA